MISTTTRTIAPPPLKLVTPLPQKHATPAKKSCWQKIWDFIKKIWRAIFGIKEKPLQLETWQINLIKETKFPSEATLGNKKIEPVAVETSPQLAPLLAPVSKLAPPKTYSPALQELRKAGQEFQALFTDVWCEEKIKAICDDISSGLDTSLTIAKTGIKWDKAEQLVTKIKETLDNKLYPIVKEKLIKKNAEKFTDLVVCRLADLIEKLDWPQTYAEIVQALSDQMKAYVAAEDSVKNNQQLSKQLTMIAHAKSIQNVEPNGAQEICNKHDLLNFLDAANKAGGEETFIKNALYAGFAEQPSCHPITKEICQLHVNGASVDIKSMLTSIEKEVFTDTTLLVLSLLFPPFTENTPDGQKKDVDGLAILWRELEIPSEFDSIMDEVKKTGQEILKEHFKGVMDAKTAIMPHVEQIIVGALKDKLKSFLVSLLESLVEELTVPKDLMQILGKDILPSIFDAAMRAFIEGRLTNPLFIDQFALLFFELIHQPTPEEATKKRNEILQVLYDKTVSEFHAFDLTTYKFTHGEFLMNASPIIEMMENMLHQNKKQKEAQPTTQEEVKAFLQLYRNTVPDEKANSKLMECYRDIFMTATFQLGNFTQEKGAISNKIIKAVAETNLKHVIAELLDLGLKPYEKSYHMAVTDALYAIKQNYLNKEVMKSWVLKQPLKKEMIEDPLKAPVQKISALTYDIIISSVSETENKLTQWGVKQALEGNEKLLEKTIYKAVSKLFSDGLINKNLIFKLNDIMSKHLKIAQQKLHMQHFSVKKLV